MGTSNRTATRIVGTTLVLLLAVAMVAAQEQPSAGQQQDAVPTSVENSTGPNLGVNAAPNQDSPGSAGQQLPDSPGAARAQQPPAQSASSTTNPAAGSAQRPVGTAAAEVGTASGVAASEPAGVAIAPAKQRRVRSFLIKMGAIAGAGVAIGAVVALSRSSPSTPPGAR